MLNSPSLVTYIDKYGGSHWALQIKSEGDRIASHNFQHLLSRGLLPTSLCTKSYTKIRFTPNVDYHYYIKNGRLTKSLVLAEIAILHPQIDRKESIPSWMLLDQYLKNNLCCTFFLISFNLLIQQNTNLKNYKFSAASGCFYPPPLPQLKIFPKRGKKVILFLKQKILDI